MAKTVTVKAPKYQEIANALQEDIASGVLQHGDRLPPERELAQSLNTSVGTLRKALALLVDEGALERVQGSGNYIKDDGREPIYSMFRLELVSGGGVPTAVVIDTEFLDKPSAISQYGGSKQGTRIRRLRFLDHMPIAVEEIWLDGAVGQLDAKSIGDSLYGTYRERFDLWITRAIDRVNVSQVPEWAPRAFQLAPGSLSGFIERQAWSDEGDCVEVSWTWFDPAKANYVQHLR